MGRKAGTKYTPEATKVKMNKSEVNPVQFNEKELSLLLKSMMNAFVVFSSVFDKKGKFISYRFEYINKAYEKITGVKLKDVKGKTVHEVWPETEDSWIKAYGSVAVTGKSSVIEMYHNPTEKMYRCIIYRPWKTKDRFCVIFSDITQEKNNEKELSEKISLLKSILDSPKSIIIFSLNRKYRYTSFNTGHKREMKKVWNADIKLNDCILDYMTIPELKKAAKKSFDRAFEGEAFSEVQFQSDKGIYYEFNWNPIFDSKKKVVGLTVFIVDISQKIKNEEDIKRVEKKYTNLYESMVDAYVKVDMKGRIVECNNEYVEMLGYEEKELKKLRYQDLTPVEWQEYEERILKEQILKKGHSEVYEKQYIKKDGTRIFVELRTSLLLNEDGNPEGMWAIVRDISDRKIMQERLKEISQIINLSPVSVFLWENSPGWPVILASDNVENIFGYKAEDFTSGRVPYSSIIHPDDLEKIKEEVKEHSKDWEVDSFEQEYRVIAKSGKVVHVIDRTFPKRDAEGKITHYQGVVSDITDKVVAVNAFRQANAKMKRAESVAGFGNWEFNLNTKRVFASGGAANIYGLSGSEGFIPEVQQIPMPEYREMLDNALLNLVEKNIPYNVEFKIKRPSDGKVLDIHSVAEYDREQHAVFGVIQNVTQMKLVEKALSAEKERLNITLQSIGEGVIAVDTDGKIILFNKAAAEITEYRADEVLGKQVSSILKFSRGSKANRKKTEGQNNSLDIATIFTLKTRNGAEKIISQNTTPIEDKSGGKIGEVIVFSDITEKQKLTEIMQRTQRLESISILAGGIAHDFNNLLSGIFGYIDMALAGCAADSPEKESLEKAMIVYERMKALTQRLLTFSKGGNPVKKTLSVAPILKESAKFSLSGTSIVCEYDIDENLRLCDIDENQISQVINNIIINAQQAMPLGGRILITAANVEVNEGEHLQLQSGKYVRISISDEGIGIPEEIIGNVFDPFFTTKQQGSGLGLATAYSIIQKHGGVIEASSIKDRGTTVAFYLPKSASSEEYAMESTAGIHRGEGCVLIMDDEKFLRDILSQMLEAVGYSTLTAENGERALEIMEDAGKKGIIIKAAMLDLTIQGGMGGVDAALLIKNVNKDIKLFATSGYSDDPVIAEPNRYGFDDSIPKPYRMKELSALFEKHFSKE